MRSPCYFHYWILIKSTNSVIEMTRWAHGGNFKNIFPRPLFIINFKPETLKFHSYSILTGDTRVEFVIYCVLNGLDFRWGFWRTLVFEQFSANSGYKNYFSRFLVFSCSIQLHHSNFSLCHAGVTKVLWKFVSSLGLAVSIWTLARFFLIHNQNISVKSKC